MAPQTPLLSWLSSCVVDRRSTDSQVRQFAQNGATVGRYFVPVLAVTFMTLWPKVVWSYDETWGIFQFRFSGLPQKGQILAEYVRRDRGDIQDFYGRRFIDLARVSYRIPIQDRVGILIGMAHIDFEQGSSENRLHQFLIANQRFGTAVDFFARVGFEQRLFEGSGERLTHRFRARAQLNPDPRRSFGAAIYNEAFFVPDGGTRFRSGWNENRFGVGLRYLTSGIELYLYHTTALWLRPRRDWDRQEWVQLQIILGF